MDSLQIVKYPDPLLRKPAEEVLDITAEIQALIPQMVQAMYANEGIGLAAPQIGRSQQIFIVETAADPRRATREGGGDAQAFLNPGIVWQSKEQAEEEEGCLSLPGIFVPVKRAERITVTCTTPDGNQVRIEAEGLLARIFQHEIDHLQGKLIIDRINPWQRWKLRNQLKQLKEQWKNSSKNS